MAVDEAIFESGIEHPERGATLRWYHWQRPTLSLGYFQAYGDRPESLLDVDCVRRVTGGGAILHDRELTYSLVVPKDCWPKASALEIVADFHQVLSALLPGPLHAHLAGADEQKEEPFLCFERRAKVDVVAQDRKLIGSAQRNRHGTILQHGSILLAASTRARHLIGIDDLAGAFQINEFCEAVLHALRQRWGWRFFSGALTDAELARAQILAKEKFANPQWTQQR